MMAKQIRKDRSSGGESPSIWSRALREIGSRTDSWLNALTGIGVAGLDKMVAADFRRSALLPDQFLEDLYNGDDVAARVIDVVPEEAMREGYEITIEPDDATDDSVAQAKQMGTNVERFLEDKLGLTEKLVEAWVWGRLFGAGALYLVIDDGTDTDQAEPLDTARIRSFKNLIVLDKRDLIPASVYDQSDNAKFGQIQTYRVNTFGPAGHTAGQLTNVQIHETRLIIFEGARTSNRERQINQGFSLSVLQRIFDVLKQFNLSFSSLANMMQSASQGVFSIHGLIEHIAAGESETMQQRMRLVDLQRSAARSVLIDAENEKFEQIGANLSGVPDSLRVFMLRIASAAKMPLTVLMGQSPAGMNATGESDRLIWAQTIRAEQTRVLKPRLMWLARLVMLSADGPTRGRVPERWEIVFPPLVQMTEEQQAGIRKTVAESDAIYIDRGVLLPEEVAINRFPMGGFSINTTIDVSDRQKILEGEPVSEPMPIAEPVSSTEPVEPDKTETVTPEAVDPGTALNGAQVKSMMELVVAAATGALPKSTTIRIMAASFPISEAEATRILEDVKEPSESTTPPPPPNQDPDGGSEHLECRPGETEAECLERLERGDQRAPAVVQTLILSKDRFETAAEARRWIAQQNKSEDADFRSDKIDETDESFRFRQHRPGDFVGSSSRTIAITNGVKAVVGRLKSA